MSGRNFVPMPGGLTFEQAAAVPIAGQTALQAVRDKGHVQPGQRVLVIGAGGGVGSFAVQIARAFGGVVTAVTRGGNVEMVRSLGADEVVDYERADFTRSGQRYDVILDAGCNRSLSALRRVLEPGRRLVLIAPAPGQWIGPMARIVGAVVTLRLSSRTVLPFLSWVSTDDLLVLKELIESGRVRPVVDRTYWFEEIPEAIRHVESGRAQARW